jgi:hypothetical protein
MSENIRDQPFPPLRPFESARECTSWAAATFGLLEDLTRFFTMAVPSPFSQTANSTAAAKFHFRVPLSTRGNGTFFHPAGLSFERRKRRMRTIGEQRCSVGL